MSNSCMDHTVWIFFSNDSFTEFASLFGKIPRISRLEISSGVQTSVYIWNIANSRKKSSISIVMVNH